MRYNRHIVLPQIDLAGQEKLLAARVLVLGVGGLGCAVAQCLCTSGTGAITLVDDDCVDITNLPRQMLFDQHQVGLAKVSAAQQRLMALNTDCRVTTIEQRLDEPAMLQQIKQHDLVLDCTDNSASRDLINRLCVVSKVTLISAAAIRFEGQLFISAPDTTYSCYGCMRTLFADPEESCTERGIFSPVVNLTGTYQAMLAMQWLMGICHLKPGTLLLFDGLRHQWQEFTVPRQPACPVCHPLTTTG